MAWKKASRVSSVTAVAEVQPDSHGFRTVPIDSDTFLFEETTDGLTVLSGAATKINGNSSNITSLQSNTANLATAISVHTSNIGSLNQSVITIETDINSLTSSLSDNSSRIATVSGDLASNVNRISTLENAGGGAVWTTSGNDIYYNSGAVGINTSSPKTKLHINSAGPNYTSVSGNDRFRISEYVTSNGNEYGLQIGHNQGTGNTSLQSYYYTNSSGAYANGYSILLQPYGGWCGVGTDSPKALTHIGKYSANSGTHNTIPSANMGSSASFPGSTNLWLAKHSNAQAEDYWGMALGTLYSSGNSYIQTLDKSNSSYYNLLLQPNGGNVGIGVTNPSAGKLDIFVPDGGTGIHIRGGNYGTNDGEAHIRIGGGGSSSDNISHHAMITGGHTSCGSSYLSFSTLLDYGTHGNSPVERMRIDQHGNVGINDTSPSYKLDVNGDIRMVGKCIVQTNNSQNGVVCTGTDGGLSYYGYQDGDPGIKFTRTSVFTGEDSEYTLSVLPAVGGTPRGNAVHLGSSSNYWRRTYTDKIYRNNEHTLSDDRIKTGETLVENATETLLKLKPQTYDKHSFEFNKFTDFYLRTR